MSNLEENHILLANLNVGDIVKGRCYEVNETFMEHQRVNYPDKYKELLKMNRNCGKKFVVTAKTEKCALDYGSEPDPYNELTFKEIDDKNQIKSDGTTYTEDDFWASYGMGYAGPNGDIIFKLRGYKIIQ